MRACNYAASKVPPDDILNRSHSQSPCLGRLEIHSDWEVSEVGVPVASEPKSNIGNNRQPAIISSFQAADNSSLLNSWALTHSHFRLCTLQNSYQNRGHGIASLGRFGEAVGSATAGVLGLDLSLLRRPGLLYQPCQEQVILRRIS